MAVLDFNQAPEENQVAGSRPRGKVKKNWWQTAVDVLTTGEQLSAGFSRASLNNENPLAGAIKGAKEDLTYTDLAFEEFRKRTGREPTGSERAELAAGGFAAGVALDPLTYVGLGAIGKVAKLSMKLPGVAKGVGTAGKLGSKMAQSKAGYSLLHNTVSNYGISPNLRKWLFRRTNKTRLANEGAKLKGQEVAKQLKGVGAGDRRIVSSLLRGEIDELPEEFLKRNPQLKPQSFHQIRQELDGIGQEWLKEGLIDEKTYRAGVGKWLPNVYAVYEGGNKLDAMSTLVGKGMKQDMLERFGILRTINKSYMDKFRREATGAMLTTGDNFGDILGDRAVREALEGAFSWDDVPNILKTHPETQVWYNANKGIVNDLVGAYKDQADDIGAAMYDFKDLGRAKNVVSGRTQLSPSQLGRHDWKVKYRVAKSVDGSGEKVGQVVTESFSSQAQRDAFAKSVLDDGHHVIKKDAPISEEFKTAMGLINEPDQLVEEAFRRGTTKMPTKKLIDYIADNERVMTKKEFRLASSEKGFKAHLFSEVPNDSLRYGKLAGKVVERPVWDNVFKADELSKVAESSDMKKWFKQALQWWKAGKTTLNPASQGRQAMANVVLTDMVAPGSFKEMPGAAKDFWKARNAFRKSGKPRLSASLRKAQEDGLFVGAFREELGAIETTARAGEKLHRTKQVARGVAKAGGAAWQRNDDLFRYTLYKHYVKKGMSSEDAVLKAHKTFFNYDDIPNVVKNARDYIPFLTFTYKVTPAFIEALYKNPGRITKWYKLENAVSSLDPRNEEFNPDEVRDFLKDQVPLWVDKDGRQNLLSTKYIYPWGGITDDKPLGAIQGGDSLLPFGLSVNPFIGETAQQVLNKDFFFQQPVAQSQLPGQRAAERAQHAARSLAPGFLGPVIPGTQNVPGGKIFEAARGRPDSTGREFNIPKAVTSDIFGAKISPVDLKREKRISKSQEKKALSDIDKEIQRVRRSKRLSSEEKRKQIRKLQDKKRELRREQRK